MRKVLVVVLALALMITAIGVLTVTADDSAAIKDGKVYPGERGNADPFHDEDKKTPHNPIHVTE